jgi:hypothetical protein
MILLQNVWTFGVGPLLPTLTAKYAKTLRNHKDNGIDPMFLALLSNRPLKSLNKYETGGRWSTYFDPLLSIIVASPRSPRIGSLLEGRKALSAIPPSGFCCFCETVQRRELTSVGSRLAFVSPNTQLTLDFSS